MNPFNRTGPELRCDGCSITTLAETYGTPLYVYSGDAITGNLRSFQDSFKDIDALICFSVKSNGNLSVLRIIAGQGAGADIVSGGELFRAMKAGIDPGKIVYSGVGKREDEIRDAVRAGIFMFNVESESELSLIARVAVSEGKTAGISLRINPDIDAGTHHYTATSKKETKFGIPESDAADLYLKAREMPGLKPIGIDVHLGSQITDIGPYGAALDRLAGMIETLASRGIGIGVVDIGGGYGISYRDERPITAAELADLVIPRVKALKCRLVIEPGRSIVGSAGVLVTRIVHVKETGHRTFYVCDAGMNDLIRPPLYGSYHRIEPVTLRDAHSLEIVDVVGPICETADYFALEREMPRCRQGDLLAVMDAGAYSFTMSSNYNARPRAAEVLVSGSQHRLIRSRETYKDLIGREL